MWPILPTLIQSRSFIHQFQFGDFFFYFSCLPLRIAASNIPSHNVQSHIYPQSQPQFVSNYLPHMGPAGNFYHLAPHIPSVYFSNFTANVNVHGYTQSMQPPYLPANFVPADNHQTSVEQVRFFFLALYILCTGQMVTARSVINK